LPAGRVLALALRCGLDFGFGIERALGVFEKSALLLAGPRRTRKPGAAETAKNGRL
jgi:hypothetical protein